MTEHQILGAMLVLQTIGIAVGIAYVARILERISASMSRNEELSREILNQVRR